MRFINARVLRVSRSVDPETREFMIDVVPEELPRNWALGQRAQVAIHVPLPPDSVTIPLEFVSHRDGQSGAWRKIDGRAIWKPIEAGTVRGVYLQVLGGLSAGDLILHPKGRYMFERVAIKELQQ
jgi:HlyD family secretion protein